MFNEKSSLYPGESKSHNNSRVESVFYLSKNIVHVLWIFHLGTNCLCREFPSVN